MNRRVTSDKTTQRALIAYGGGVDQYPALNWLPCNTRKHVEAFLQCASGVSAIECHLAHQGVRETMRTSAIAPSAISAARIAWTIRSSATK